MKSVLVRAFMLLFVASVCLPALVLAQDPVEVAPDIYSCNFENDRVRVCEVTIKPGARIGTHSHPDHFAYPLSAGKIEITKDGKAQVVEFEPGEVVWVTAEAHSGKNIGDTEVKLLVIELKEPA